MDGYKLVDDVCPFCGGTGRAATFYGHKQYICLKFQISRTSVVWMCLSEPVTQEAIGKLVEMLKMQQDTFPTNEELRNPTITYDSTLTVDKEAMN